MDELTELRKIVEKLAHPERFAEDFKQWHSGDGPFEYYCAELQQGALALLKKLGRLGHLD